MIEMDDDGDITSYTYDRENRLIEAELPDSTTIEYEYGPEGDRFKRYDGTDTIYYVYDGEDVLMELDGSGNVEARYTHVSGGFSVDYPLMMRRGGENYFYMKDRLGSVVGLLDDEENVEVAYEYDAWGTIVAEVGSLWNPYRFTAREWDPDTGDYYYRARTYKPETGRFMQIDPMGMVDGTDMFVYVKNSPILNVDPYGMYLVPYSEYKEYEEQKCLDKLNRCLDDAGAQSAYDNCISDAGKERDDCKDKCDGWYGYGVIGTLGWAALAVGVGGVTGGVGAVFVIGVAGAHSGKAGLDWIICYEECDDEYNHAIDECGTNPQTCYDEYNHCLDSIGIEGWLGGDPTATADPMTWWLLWDCWLGDTHNPIPAPDPFY